MSIRTVVAKFAPRTQRARVVPRPQHTHRHTESSLPPHVSRRTSPARRHAWHISILHPLINTPHRTNQFSHTHIAHGLLPACCLSITLSPPPLSPPFMLRFGGGSPPPPPLLPSAARTRTGCAARQGSFSGSSRSQTTPQHRNSSARQTSSAASSLASTLTPRTCEPPPYARSAPRAVQRSTAAAARPQTAGHTKRTERARHLQ